MRDGRMTNATAHPARTGERPAHDAAAPARPAPPPSARAGGLVPASALRPLAEEGKAILERPVFDRLLFGQYWEDPRLDEASLDIGPGKTLLSIVSGGCNTLSLALLGPERVLAVDLNAAQIRLLELKMAGACALDHRDYLELLGAVPSRSREALYRAARPFLSGGARRFWDAHVRTIRAGVIRQGRYERYLAAFRRLLLVIEGSRRVRRLFELSSAGERRRFYHDEWDTPAWRLFFRVAFSRTVLGRGGLDPQFFTYVEEIPDFGEHFRRLAEHVLVDLPAADNYFLAQICLGRYQDETAMPPYLLEKNFDALREAIPRVEILPGELEHVLRSLPSRSVDAFHLSNIFEWVSPDAFERMLGEIHRVGRPGARLCYRNLLVRRRHPRALDSLFRPEDALAARLATTDRSFVYSGFEVATVLAASRTEAPS